MIRTLNDERFEQDVLQDGGPCIVLFTAPWAGPCNLAREAFLSASRQYANRVLFFEFGIDDNPNTPEAYGLRSVPAFYTFRNGTPVEVIAGAIPESRIVDMVEMILE